MHPRLFAVLATLMLATLPAAAQDAGKPEFAGKTLTIVVPFSPGAVSDPLARVIASKRAPNRPKDVAAMPALEATMRALDTGRLD